MRARRRLDSQGTATMMIIPAVMVLMLAGLLIIRNVGSATTDSRQAQAGADAAALGAVKAWSDSMEMTFYASAGSTELIPETQYTYPFSFFRGTPISMYTMGTSAAAASYASANNCYVTNMSLDTTKGKVTVTVRNMDTVSDTGQQAERTATAQFSFPQDSGACMTEGGILGHNQNGGCDTQYKGGPVGTPYKVEIKLVGDSNSFGWG
ncbi:MAG: pilus assembly protein TadG-related protein [Micrococcales bacterium]|nr:pilus assembly protein TadG-related protein [Micrococcales bacterium]